MTTAARERGVDLPPPAMRALPKERYRATMRGLIGRTGLCPAPDPTGDPDVEHEREESPTQ